MAGKIKEQKNENGKKRAKNEAVGHQIDNILGDGSHHPACLCGKSVIACHLVGDTNGGGGPKPSLSADIMCDVTLFTPA
ncbi:MAG: hypothetical protein ACK529_07215 [Alphaproteobacteria bacterium]